MNSLDETLTGSGILVTELISYQLFTAHSLVRYGCIKFLKGTSNHSLLPDLTWGMERRCCIAVRTVSVLLNKMGHMHDTCWASNGFRSECPAYLVAVSLHPWCQIKQEKSGWISPLNPALSNQHFTICKNMQRCSRAEFVNDCRWSIFYTDSQSTWCITQFSCFMW